MEYCVLLSQVESPWREPPHRDESSSEVRVQVLLNDDLPVPDQHIERRRCLKLAEDLVRQVVLLHHVHRLGANEVHLPL